MYKCPYCGSDNAFVNQCGCDPNNMPTKPQYDFCNPLGFYCPPNGTDPHYATAYDFERFVAFGMLACHQHLVGDGTDALMATKEDVYYLRKQLLDELENALLALPILKEEAEGAPEGKPIWYEGDHAEGGPSIPCRTDERNPEDTPLCFEWHLLRYCPEGSGDQACLLFELTYFENPETFPIWLAVDAIKDDAKDIIEKARQANEAIGKYEERPGTQDGPDADTPLTVHP